MPTLPLGLKPVMDGYSIAAPDGVLRTPVMGGLPRYGLDWDRGCERVSVPMVLDSMQFSVWTAFYHRIVSKGAIPFDMPLDTGAGVQTHSVQIVPDTYTAARAAGDNWRVAFTVQTESSAYTVSEAGALSAIAAFEAASGAPLIAALRPRVAGYSMDGPDGVMAGDVPGGRPGIAMAWDQSCQRFQVTLVLNKVKFWAWTLYFHHVAKKGAVAFPMYLDSGLGVTQHQVNVVPGSYTATRSGALWAVTFVVEAEPDVYAISVADAQALIDLFNGIGDITDELLARIATFANVDTLVLA